MYLSDRGYLPWSMYINPGCSIDSKIVEKFKLDLKLEEIKYAPTFGEVSAFLLPLMQRNQVLIGFDILESARLLKKEFGLMKPAYDFDVSNYQLVDPWLVFKHQVNKPDELLKLYKADPDFKMDDPIEKLCEIFWAQEIYHEKFFTEGFDYVQIKTIGDVTLSGKWFKIELDSNGQKTALFRIGKYKNEVINPLNADHTNYLKWLYKNIEDLTKDEKEFIAIVIKAGK